MRPRKQKTSHGPYLKDNLIKTPENWLQKFKCRISGFNFQHSGYAWLLTSFALAFFQVLVRR
jgi:hypothetical protein